MNPTTPITISATAPATPDTTPRTNGAPKSAILHDYQRYDQQFQKTAMFEWYLALR